MSEPKYNHLSLARHKENIILITAIEQKSEKNLKWYEFSGGNPVWYYSGKILNTTNPECPRFTGRVEDIPEEEIMELEVGHRRRFPQENPAVIR